MDDDIYCQLREWLEQIGLGFSVSESNIEINILKKFFTEEEARMCLVCKAEAEPIETIAKRAGRDPDQIAYILEQMARKGLLFSCLPKTTEPSKHYAVAPWVGGLLRFHSPTMDEELSQLVFQHFVSKFKRKRFSKRGSGRSRLD